MGILEQMRSWTPDQAGGRTDFDDLPASVYKPRAPKESVRIVDATAAERKQAAREAAALRDHSNAGMSDYANPKMDNREALAGVGQPTVKQTAFMLSLLNDLASLDVKTATAAHAYMVKMTNNKAWTTGRGGNASRWIDHMIGKAKALRAAARTAPTTAAAPAAAPAAPKYDTFSDITDGNYAISRDGKTHFYRVTRREGKGQYAGRTFINLQERASEQLFRVEGAWPVRQAILKSIREAGPEAAHLLYSEKLDRCWHCNILLTDDRDNPYRPFGLGPVCGPKVMG